jgi:hypothetical protein
MLFLVNHVKSSKVDGHLRSGFIVNGRTDSDLLSSYPSYRLPYESPHQRHSPFIPTTIPSHGQPLAHLHDVVCIWHWHLDDQDVFPSLLLGLEKVLLHWPTPTLVDFECCRLYCTERFPSRVRQV